MNEKICNEYFAAANGFSGFRSYFNEVFNPTKFDKRFIIKGGPGTGKSTLMKNIQNAVSDLVCECEVILCSSDPKSYDGLIITSYNGRRIALIDGTAPHETDAVYPGFIDELVNLGECWNEFYLKSKKDELLHLNAKKKKAYKNAYNLLQFAGIACDSACSLHRIANYKFNLDIFDNNQELNHGRNYKFKLLSAFSKDGFLHKKQKEFEKSRKISLIGNPCETQIIFKKIIEFAMTQNIDFIRYPSPLSDDYTDAIYLINQDTLVTQNDEQNEKLECKKIVLSENSELSTFYNNEYEQALKMAQNEFNNASINHFELEKIYTAAMDFSLLNQKYKSVLNSIYDIIE